MLGQKIRELRRRKLLSQRDLARIAHVTYVTIQKLETGATGQPRPSTLRKIAGALGMTTEEMFELQSASTLASTAADSEN
jgi:transcriptional regulator with XRE-family HTH domain